MADKNKIDRSQYSLQRQTLDAEKDMREFGSSRDVAMQKMAARHRASRGLKKAFPKSKPRKRPGVKGGGPGESLHRRATDPRESRPALLGMPTMRRRGRMA